MADSSPTNVVSFARRDTQTQALSALDALHQLVETRQMARRSQDFSTFERELHQRVMAFEREILARELAGMDIDEPEIMIEGIPHRRTLRSKQTYLTSAGEVVVERTLYRPRGDPYAPAVAAVDLDVGIVDGYLTPTAANLALYVVTELTPSGAAALFKRIGNMQPSKSTLDRLPKHVSATWEKNRESFEEALRAATVIPQNATTVAVSLDGVLAPSTDGDGAAKRERTADAGQLTRGPAGYREFSCATLSFCDAKGEMISSIRFARAPEANKATLKTMIEAELAVVRERRPDLALVKLADGAADNWTFLARTLKDGVELVDFFHAAEHLNEALGAAYGEGTTEARRRFANLRHVLLEEDEGVERVIRALDYLRRKHKRHTTIAQAASYFRKHRHRMSYAAAKKAGLPIGSGVVEAACKTLVTQRLKRSGMRWSDDGAQAVLTPRGWVQSERFDEAWVIVASTWQVNVTFIGQVVPISRAG
jgi:hypothetical protein